MIYSRTLWLLLLIFGVTACTEVEHEELQQWMAEQRSLTRPQVSPIQEPKKFTPQAYGQESGEEPFSSVKLTQALRQQSSNAAANGGLIAPELIRRKEPLESMALDNMAMVGSLNKNGQLVALLKVDNLLYQVKLGNYLGQNYGRITKVSETEVVLREIVQDPTGEWIERVATLQLQEGSR